MHEFICECVGTGVHLHFRHYTVQKASTWKYPESPGSSESAQGSLASEQTGNVTF